MPDFDDLGFAHQFDVELDPEFSGDGQWSCPTLAFDERGEPTPLLGQSGTPMLVHIRPHHSPDWVASFAGGWLRTRGLYALPSPDQLLVIVDAPLDPLVAPDPED